MSSAKNENRQERGALGERMRRSLWLHWAPAVPCLGSAKCGEGGTRGLGLLRAFSPKGRQELYIGDK